MQTAEDECARSPHSYTRILELLVFCVKRKVMAVVRVV